MNGKPSLVQKEIKNQIKELQSCKDIEENFELIELLPTFNKINLVQIVVKEMLSTKERFDENKNKMIDKIRLNCYKYYKNFVSSKDIIDNFKFKENEHLDYILINNASKVIEKDLYNKIYNFFFFLRDNNEFLLKIMNHCKPSYVQDLSYFIAHFFYENTINNNDSFIQIELQIIIYFLIEKIIDKNPEDIFTYIPQKENKENNEKDKDNEYENFLYNILLALNTKPDVRNYLNILLSDFIIQIDNGKHRFLYEIIKKKINDNDKIKSQYTRIEEDKIDVDFNFTKTATFKGELKPHDNKLFERFEKSTSQQINESKKLVRKNLNINCSDNNLLDNIDRFFIEHDTNAIFISELLNYYQNIKPQNSISLAMSYFLSNNYNHLVFEDEGEGKFRNNYFFVLSVLCKNDSKEQKDKKDNYFDNIKKKYELLTNCMTSIIKKLGQTITNIPTPIKNILNAMDKLIDKKMSQEKEIKKVVYIKLMSKLQILIGNIILPMLNEYHLFRILNEHILSVSTSEVLRGIIKIFNAILSGKLFDSEDPEFTIFNKYIITILPKLLNFSINIGNSNNTSNTRDCYSSIFEKLVNSFEKINDNERIIDYNELNDKNDSDQNIIYQSICFNWDILFMLVKIVQDEKELFISNNNSKLANKIFEDILICYNDIQDLSNKNNEKKEYEFYFIDKLIYKEEFEQKINSIIQDNFKVILNNENDQEITRFKKCLSEILGYVGRLHEEDFLPFITPKKNIQIYSNNKTNEIINYKKLQLYNKIKFESSKNDIKRKNDNIMIERTLRRAQTHNLDYEERFFRRRKSIVFPIMTIKEENNNQSNTDFKTVLFPQIMNLIKTEIGNSFTDDKFQRITFCSSYLQTHFDNLPEEYKKNDYSRIFTEIIADTIILIQELQNNILNEFFIKIRYAEKINEITNKVYNHIKNMEKLFYIKCLYKNTKIFGNIIIEKDPNNEIIKKVKFEPSQNNESKLVFIKSFLKEIPNMVEYDSIIEQDIDFLKNEENIGLIETVNDYFTELKKTIKSDKMMTKLSIIEFHEVLYGLENYILKKLYKRLYPNKQSKEDIFIYKKCVRLSFLKPDNIIKDKKFKKINEKSLEVSIEFIKEMDNNTTPMDKINCFKKAMNFMSNSMEFNSGKTDFGVDDLLPLLIYIVIKAKPEKLSTNYNYCLLYLNKDLSKKQYGSLLTQIGIITNVIIKMKHTDLNDVSEEQFGFDEEA